jgi:hypothetical protein
MIETTRKDMKYEEIVQLIEKTVEYIEQNWNKYAYIDNLNCIKIRLSTIPILKQYFEKNNNRSLKREVYSEIISRLSKKYKIKRLQRSRIEICRETCTNN